jgi:hypothetical protein
MFYKVFDAVTVTSAVTFIEHFCWIEINLVTRKYHL